jgi:predicted transcriptional regulator
MKVKEIVEQLGLQVVGGAKGLEKEVTGAYVSDLLSDVMGNVEEGNVWVTLQTHKNVMAVSSLREVAAVLLVNNFKAESDMLEQADEEEIPVLSTDLSTFEITGRLYNLLK